MGCTVREGEGSSAGCALVDLGEIVIGTDYGFTLRRAEDGRYLGPDGWAEAEHLWGPSLVEHEATTVLHAGPEIGRWIGEETWIEIVLPGAAFRAKTTWPVLSFAAPDGGRRRRSAQLVIDALPLASKPTIPLPARQAPRSVRSAQGQRPAPRTIDVEPLPEATGEQAKAPAMPAPQEPQAAPPAQPAAEPPREVTRPPRGPHDLPTDRLAARHDQSRSTTLAFQPPPPVQLLKVSVGARPTRGRWLWALAILLPLLVIIGSGIWLFVLFYGG